MTRGRGTESSWGTDRPSPSLVSVQMTQCCLLSQVARLIPFLGSPKKCACSLQTILPAAAQDVYYRDEIGNVSTSHLLVLDDSVEMEIRPRFPLFGGWKTHYIVGYNLPSYEYLYNLGQSQ